MKMINLSAKGRPSSGQKFQILKINAGVFLFLFFVIMLVYLKSLSFGLVNYDDNQYIINHRDFIQKLSNIPKAFQKDAFISEGIEISYYRPLPVVTYIIDWTIGGKNLFVYHLTNVVFHLSAAFLLYLFLIKCNTSRFLALFFSTLFAVHPVLSHVAVWLPARNESLFTLFFLASTISFINWVRDSKFYQFVLHLVFFLLAFFNKETAIFLPFICLLYLFSMVKKEVLIKKLIYAPLWLLVFGIWLSLRSGAIKNAETITTISLFGEPRNLLALFEYIGKAFIPFSLSSFPLLNTTHVLFGFAITVILIFFLVTSKKKNMAYVAIGICWFLSMLVLTFFTNVPNEQFYLYEFRLYPAIIGLFLIVKEIDWVKDIAYFKFRFFAFLIPLIFSLATFFYINQYKNPLTFYRHAIVSSPNAARPYLNFGYIYHNIYHKPKEALILYEAALRINPQMPGLSIDIGNAFLAQNNYDAAESSYLNELKYRPNDVKALYNLGSLSFKKKNYVASEKYWKKIIQLSPHSYQPYFNLATIYSLYGDVEKASNYYSVGKKLQQKNE